MTKTFGNTNEESSTNEWTANQKRGCIHTLTERGAVSSIHWYVAGSGSGVGSQVFKGIIHAADGGGGVPDTLVATGSENTVTDGQALGWIVSDVDPPVVLSAGDYHIGSFGGPNTKTIQSKYVASGTDYYIEGDDYADGPAANFGVASTRTRTYSAYVTYTPSPIVTGVSPNRGPITGGTEVVITGSNFTDATSVDFEYGGDWILPAASFDVDNDGQITATTDEAIEAAVVDVRVTTAGGQSLTTEDDEFSYYAVNTKTFTLDGIVKEINSKTFTLDGFIAETKTKTYTVDGFVAERKTKTYTVDGVIRNTIEYYSRGNPETLPIDAAVQATLYSSDDYTDVATSDDNRVSISSTANYLNHLFKVRAADNTKHIKVEVEVQSSKAPSVSTVYLQIYNRNSEEWETLDSDTTTAADTDFSLIGYQDTNLSYYYDANYEISFRVYQGVS